MTDVPLSAPGAAATATRRRLNPTLARYLSAFRTPRGVIGLSILGIMVLAALLAPVLFPGGYDQQGSNALTGPSAQHIFGVDEFGRDIFIRSVYGLRVDLSLILTAVPLSMAVGTLIGLSGAISEWLGAAVAADARRHHRLPRADPRHLPGGHPRPRVARRCSSPS